MHAPRNLLARPVAFAIALVLGAAALSSCGAAADKVAEKATEKAIESQTGGDVDIDTKGDGSVDIKTKDGSLSIGSTDLPDEWPTDIELPEAMTITSNIATDVTDGRMVQVSGVTDASAAEVAAEIASQLDGWEVVAESDMNADGGALITRQWKQGGRQVILSVAGSEGETTVSIAHQVEN